MMGVVLGRSRLVGLLSVVVLVAAAMAAVGAAAGAAEGSNAPEATEADADVSFSSVEELLGYIDASEDFDGQFQPHIVPAAAFSSDGFDPDSSFFSFFDGTVRGNAANDGCLKAPVQLPNGATIVNLFGYLYDDDGSGDIQLSLRRKQNGNTDSSETLASVTTTGSSTGVQIPGDTTVTEPVVNNASYSYFLTACVGSADRQINGAWIFTEPADDTYTVFGPEAQIEVITTGPPADRTLLNLTNFGATSMKLHDAAVNAGWLFGTRGTGLAMSEIAGTTDVLVGSHDTTHGVIVQNTTPAVGARTLFRLENKGAVRFQFKDIDADIIWQFQIGNNGAFAISRQGTGGPEFQVFEDGSMAVGPGSGQTLFLDAAGNLTVAGDVIPNGLAGPDTQGLVDRIADLEARLAAMEALLAQPTGG